LADRWPLVGGLRDGGTHIVNRSRKAAMYLHPSITRQLADARMVDLQSAAVRRASRASRGSRRGRRVFDRPLIVARIQRGAS